jgi:hypothetical protein
VISFQANGGDLFSQEPKAAFTLDAGASRRRIVERETWGDLVKTRRSKFVRAAPHLREFPSQSCGRHSLLTLLFVSYIIRL